MKDEKYELAAKAFKEGNATEFARRMEVLEWFSAEMAKKLELRIPRGDWTGMDYGLLLSGMLLELVEVADATRRGVDSDVVAEAVDVANYALMIADVARRRK